MAPLDSTDSDDTPRNLICSRFPGGKGPHYDIWEKNLLDAFEGKGDEDASWADTLLGTDPQAGLTPAQARRRQQRRRETYSYLLRLQEDESLKNVLRAEGNKNGFQALKVLRRECKDPSNALTTSVKLAEWHGLSIKKDVGYEEETVAKFNRLLTSKNADLPAGTFDADALVEKLLGAIKAPSSLAAECDKLLQSSKDDLPARFYGASRTILVHAGPTHENRPGRIGSYTCPLALRDDSCHTHPQRPAYSLT